MINDENNILQTVGRGSMRSSGMGQIGTIVKCSPLLLVFLIFNVAQGSFLHPDHGVLERIFKSVFTGIFLVILSIMEGLRHRVSFLGVAAILIALWWTGRSDKPPIGSGMPSLY